MHIDLKYGCDPHQKHARVVLPDPSPLKVLRWLLQQHAQVLGLRFRPGLKRPEKANAIDQFLLWDELPDPEREALAAGLEEVPPPAVRDDAQPTENLTCLPPHDAAEPNRARQEARVVHPADVPC